MMSCRMRCVGQNIKLMRHQMESRCGGTELAYADRKLQQGRSASTAVDICMRHMPIDSVKRRSDKRLHKLALSLFLFFA